MKNIIVFGSSTKTGQYIKRIYNLYFQNINLYGFSRKAKDNYYLDLESITLIMARNAKFRAVCFLSSIFRRILNL